MPQCRDGARLPLATGRTETVQQRRDSQVHRLVIRVDVHHRDPVRLPRLAAVRAEHVGASGVLATNPDASVLRLLALVALREASGLLRCTDGAAVVGAGEHQRPSALAMAAKIESM